MGILTILFFLVVILSIYFLFVIVKKEYKDFDLTLKRLKLIKATGTFALATGILGQMIGLYSAFSYIQKAGEVSPEILMGGLRVSMITTLYGMIIFLISYLLWTLNYYLATKK